ARCGAPPGPLLGLVECAAERRRAPWSAPPSALRATPGPLLGTAVCAAERRRAPWSAPLTVAAAHRRARR
ncbi:hypothetical protein, partial [Streptomyces hygroscopicus]|uniref:hypothetical protein n=1 Tax=Streptomyces hygroscopicus TaxID=1912 RepID=UPI001B806E7A